MTLKNNFSSRYIQLALHIVSWIFGLIFFSIGILNLFWGNDPGFGVFIILLSSIYFLPVNDMLRKTVSLSIPGMSIVKIFLAIFIIWVALGVGELFDKLELMKMDL
ncbi:hypothetical protein WJR50_20020 [Catalinimonas sp. 4WD22]|uniref:hypothetical protein n=1 Tax=Catalinimonas locisalis TaxID=3133978 RepID=UPI0031019C77